MANQNDAVVQLLSRLAEFRRDANILPETVEASLLLGPGWIARFEAGLSLPTLDLLLLLLRMYGRHPADLFRDVDVNALGERLARNMYAAPDGGDLLVHFGYAQFDAVYRLRNATVEQYTGVMQVLRNGLARLVDEEDEAEALKADAVANAFLHAVATWPTANPSDLWWFIIYRAYLDPFNHPANFARIDFGQSWKRTGGWALEEVIVRHYAPFLAEQGVALYIASNEEKRSLAAAFQVRERLETDKIDVVIAGIAQGSRLPFGALHVKASFAERRTDDVPMSRALIAAGYTSPLWTMDCKSTPSREPTNRGELGLALGAGAGGDRRSAKRKDIEDDAYFSACFSYNRNTVPTPDGQNAAARVYCCDFSTKDDAFSRFLVAGWQRFRQGRIQ
ncbi:MAG: hypothetical protein JNM43_18040 [Planctomycetaceae bacterium]|nr:hypothetical protein [Planctomycetaceae bacterium]